jgi:MoxR-like ATPase
MEWRPRSFCNLSPIILHLDELEKMNKKDQTSLLNLMESGILSELKHNQQRTTQLKTWVFASCNSTDNLLPPLLTRFRDIHIKPVDLVELSNDHISKSRTYNDPRKIEKYCKTA